MQIGDLLFAFRGDGSLLQADAIKAGGQAGETAGKTFSQKFATGVKVAGGAIAGGFAVALGAAVIGRFAALERATADFRRETGATAEEAERAGKAINDMAGRSLEPIETIGRTLTAVTVQWGLHGEAAEQAAEKVLEFARATGIDAESAVNGLDDVMDNWNLTAEDSQALMDKLIVSHQRWGGNIEENIGSLAGLAPAMKAANFEIDDGIALLGLFGSKGLDANQGAAAFAKALTKVKSPAELQNAIDDISNTADAFDRARKAAALFGARAGAKLANALGGAHLDDYAVSMEDAAGATDKAAEASLTLADKVQIAFRNITSSVVGVLGENGSLIQGVAGLGTLLGPTIASVGKKIGVALGVATGAGMLPKLAALIGVAGVSDDIAAASSGLGGRMGRLLGFGIAIGLAVAASELDKPLSDIGKQINKAIFPENGNEGMLAGTFLDSIGDGLHEAWYQLGQNDPLASERTKAMQRQAHEGGVTFSETLGEEISGGLRGVVAAAFEKARGSDGAGGAEAATTTGQDLGYATLEGYGQALQGAADYRAYTDWYEQMLAAGRKKNEQRSRQNAAETAGTWKSLLAKALLDGRDEAVKIVAQLPSELHHAIVSQKGRVRSAMMELKWAMEHPLARSEEIAYLKGKLTGDRLAKGLRSKRGYVRAAARETYRVIESELVAALTAAGRTLAGWNAGVRLATGNATQRRQFRHRKGEKERALGGPVRRGMPYIVGERRPELFVPDQNGTILPRVPSGGSMEVRVYDERVVVKGPSGTQEVALASSSQAIRRWRS